MINNNSSYVEDEKDAKPGADEHHEDDHKDAEGHHEDDHDGEGHDKDGHDKEGHDDDHGDGHDHDAGHADDGPWDMAKATDYYLNPDHLIGHVQDAHYFELFGFKDEVDEHGHKTYSKNKLEIPWISPWTEEEPFFGENGTYEFKTSESQFIGPVTFQPSKFVILELIGALIVCAIFIPYARRIRGGERPKGRFWNMIDAAVCYVKNEIAVPSIGSQDAARFLPFVWTMFFYVLVLNLIGMVPGLGAATGSISVTSAFALVVFFVVMGTGMKKMGVVGFIKAQAPHLDINPVLKAILIPMIWAIEMFGLMIKHIVLAVRLFANMFAGHLVVGVFVAFIGVTWGFALGWGVAPMAVVASIAINLLELLVAFIQAYVFAFLTSLFIGTAIHPH